MSGLVLALLLAQVRADLERVAQRDVFFAHQSVGRNVLDGVARLAFDAGVAVRIRDELAGVNGDPDSKLRAFAAAVDASAPEVALLKLCWADFDAGTDAAALFRRYRTAIDALRARHPATVFVHVTAPLVTVQGGIGARIKKLAGASPGGFEANARRDEYNRLLRQAYEGREPIFDLARVESTAPDGRPSLAEWNGSAVPSLAAAYTDDGGHLNREGSARAAKALLAVLAAAK